MVDFGVGVPYELLQLYSGLDGDQTLQLVAPDLNARERQVVLEAHGARALSSAITARY